MLSGPRPPFVLLTPRRWNAAPFLLVLSEDDGVVTKSRVLDDDGVVDVVVVVRAATSSYL